MYTVSLCGYLALLSGLDLTGCWIRVDGDDRFHSESPFQLIALRWEERKVIHTHEK